MKRERVYAINVAEQDIRRSRKRPSVYLFFEHGRDREEAITRFSLEGKFDIDALKSEGRDVSILQVYEVEVEGYKVLLRK